MLQCREALSSLPLSLYFLLPPPHTLFLSPSQELHFMYFDDGASASACLQQTRWGWWREEITFHHRLRCERLGLWCYIRQLLHWAEGVCGVVYVREQCQCVTVWGCDCVWDLTKSGSLPSLILCLATLTPGLYLSVERDLILKYCCLCESLHVFQHK